MMLDLDRVADLYRNQGYTVVVHPNADQLPAFAQGFRIEILGRRGSHGVLVAVRKNREEMAADSDLPRYAEVIGSQPGWRFDLAILEGEDPHARDGRDVREFSGEDIARSLDQANLLAQTGFSRFAFVAAWAAFEAAMRMRLRAFGQKAGWGSKPWDMLRELYSAGALAPDEYRRIERASKLRNQIVHGFMAQPTDNDSEADLIQLLADVARRFVSESQLVKQPA